MYRPFHILHLNLCISVISLLLLPGTAAAEEPMRLTLAECIAMARRQSVEAAVALGELRSAYWQWRSYRADLLPEVSFSATTPSYNKRYTSYQQADGGVTFVRNNYLGLSGTLHISQKIFFLTEQFNNQLAQLHIAEEADSIAGRRYHTNVETFKIGSISTLELSDAQTAKDEARQNRILQLFNFWYYYYQLRSLTLWDFERGESIDADFEKLVR